MSHISPKEEVDVEQVKKVFPYGQLLPVEFQRGGMRASSGIELPEMGGEIMRTMSLPRTKHKLLAGPRGGGAARPN